jgi:hypothetical protein
VTQAASPARNSRAAQRFRRSSSPLQQYNRSWGNHIRKSYWHGNQRGSIQYSRIQTLLSGAEWQSIRYVRGTDRHGMGVWPQGHHHIRPWSVQTQMQRSPLYQKGT